MPAGGDVIIEQARYFPFAFNLNIASPVFKRAPNCTVVTGGAAVLPGDLRREATAHPEQGK